MEKSNKEMPGGDLDESRNILVTDNVVEDLAEKQHDQMKDHQSELDNGESAGNKTPKGLTGGADFESGKILQSTASNFEAVGELQKETIIADKAFKESSETTRCILPNEAFVEEVSKVPTECNTQSLSTEDSTSSLRDKQISACIEGKQYVTEPDKHLETEHCEQELLVEKADQVMELVLEESAICVEKQQMEEATDIEEPQKYAFREKGCD